MQLSQLRGQPDVGRLLQCVLGESGPRSLFLYVIIIIVTVRYEKASLWDGAVSFDDSRTQRAHQHLPARSRTARACNVRDEQS